MTTTTIDDGPDPLPGLLSRANDRQRQAIMRAVGVPTAHVRVWSEMPSLMDLAPWVRAAMLDVLTSKPPRDRR